MGASLFSFTALRVMSRSRYLLAREKSQVGGLS
jgi:hypothetical protein